LLDGFEGYFVSLVVGLGFGGLEFAVDGDEDVLIEARIGFHARFRLLAAFEDVEVVREEADSPFECGDGVVMLQGVRLALGLFDEVSVSDTGSRPGLREMVGVDLEEAASQGGAAGNDVFLVTATFFDRVDFADNQCEHVGRLKVAHTSGVRRDGDRIWDKVANIAAQTVNHACF